MSNRSLLADEATQRLRGEHALASHTTLWRFCAGADTGRAQKAAAVNRAMLRRAWGMGAAPELGLLTIDPDATWISTYGPGKEGSAFSYKHEVGMSPMLGVCGETGDVLALRARGGNANAGRAVGSFIDECVSAIPVGCRRDYQLWVRIDSAGYRADVVEAAERHNAAFTVTAKGYRNVRAVIETLARDDTTQWCPALGAEDAKGSEIAETMFRFAERDLRMIVRRQPTVTGDQLSLDDLDGFRFHAIITNIPPMFGSAVDVEHHHRLRGGAPEEAIRQLKGDFGLCHAPLENFFGNWLWWHAAALAYNVARWVRVLALPACSAPAAANDCASRSSTSPPASSVTPGASTCACPAPTPMPPRSSKPSPAYGDFPSSPEPDRHNARPHRRQPTRPRTPGPTRAMTSQRRRHAAARSLTLPRTTP